MISLNNHLCPNKEEITAKIIDGEAIIINISTGVYYSMDNVGAALWNMIEKEYTLQECITEIVNQYDVTNETAKTDAERLASDLLKENLVATLDNENHHGAKPELVQNPKSPYESPKLNIYRDMEELLALDPPTPGLEKIVWDDKPDENTK